MQFSSGLTKHFFQEFTSTFQSLKSSHHQGHPFVYVSQEGQVKLITDFMEMNENSDIFACTIAEDGWIEYLSFQD